MPTAAPSVVPTAGILTIPQTAETLGCSALQVKRLIARRRLKATRLRANARGPGAIGRQVTAELRVLASEVARYVADGAEDFEAPAFNSANAWFLDPEGNYADLARAELSAACEPQVLADADVIARFRGETANRARTGYVDAVAKSYEVKLKATAEVMEASKSARLAASGIAMKQLLGRCKTWLRLLAVTRLRALARGCIGEAQEALQVRAGAIRSASPTISIDPLDSLYDLEVYDLVCVLAMAKLKETKVVAFRRTTQLPDALDGSVIVSYSLPFTAIKFDEQQLLDLAF